MTIIFMTFEEQDELVFPCKQAAAVIEKLEKLGIKYICTPSGNPMAIKSGANDKVKTPPKSNEPPTLGAINTKVGGGCQNLASLKDLMQSSEDQNSSKPTPTVQNKNQPKPQILNPKLIAQAKALLNTQKQKAQNKIIKAEKHKKLVVENQARAKASRALKAQKTAQLLAREKELALARKIKTNNQLSELI